MALIVLMAQIGCRVPARSAKLTPVDAIYTRYAREIFLRKQQARIIYLINSAEWERPTIFLKAGALSSWSCRRPLSFSRYVPRFIRVTRPFRDLFAQHSTANSLVILDELGRGTSTHDGYADRFLPCGVKHRENE